MGVGALLRSAVFESDSTALRSSAPATVRCGEALSDRASASLFGANAFLRCFFNTAETKKFARCLKGAGLEERL